MSTQRRGRERDAAGPGVGGGRIGTTSAYYLPRRGCRLTLLEARTEVGLETSFANGGLITPSMSDPWAAPNMTLDRF